MDQSPAFSDALATLRAGFPVEIPDPEWAWFAGQVERREWAKGEVLVPQGRPAEAAYFLLRGLVQYFWEGPGARDVTFGFDFEGRFATDVESFFSLEVSERVPARRSVRALEDIDCLVLRRSLLELAYERHPVWDEAMRLSLQRVLLHRSDKEHRIRTLTPEERYSQLLEEDSPLAHRVPQYLLAAYLGIAPETRSRIRARM